jgi:hypothetical protein
MRRQLALCSLLFAGCFSAGDPPLRCSPEQPACPDGLVCSGVECVTPGSDLGQAVDLSVVSLCADGKGQQLGTKGAWACPGAFAFGKATGQCAPTAKLCTDSGTVTDAECTGLKAGFFISSNWGTADTSNAATSECNTGNNPFPSAFGWFGCGVASVVTTNGCVGFRPFLKCSSMTKLSCQGVPPLVSNSEPLNGVICCPK